MKVISKTKPKGTEYNALKNMKKAARIVKNKEDRRRAEAKRQNAESRKERRIEGEFYDKVKNVQIKGYNKGMLIVLVNGEIEKRNLVFGRRTVNLAENIENLHNFKLKLFGEEVEIKYLQNYNEMKDEIAWAIQENL